MAKVGMWIFLLSDALMFAGFLLAYGILRGGADQWHSPGEPELGINFTAGLTFLLICSSVSMVFAFAAAQDGDRVGTPARKRDPASDRAHVLSRSRCTGQHHRHRDRHERNGPQLRRRAPLARGTSPAVKLNLMRLHHTDRCVVTRVSLTSRPTFTDRGW